MGASIRAASGVRRGTRRSGRRHDAIGWASVPALIAVAVLYLGPLLGAATISVLRSTLGGVTAQFTTLNYQVALSNANFWNSLVRVLQWALVAVPVQVAVALALALGVSSVRIPGVRYARVLLALPMFIPAIVTAYAWKWMLIGVYGLLTYATRVLLGHPVPWIDSTQVAWISVLMADSWRAIPFLTLILYAATSGVPRDLVEAAVTDGASSSRVVSRIIIPTIAPALWLCAVIRLIDLSKMFVIPDIMTQGGPAFSTETPSMVVYQDAFLYGNYGSASAESLIFTAAVAAVVLLYLWRGAVRYET